MRNERTVVTITDDLTGEEQPEGTGRTVSYGFDGKTYEIDLSDDNVEAFTRLLQPYLEKSRRVRASHAVTPAGSRVGTDGRRRGGGRPMGKTREEMAEIRAWLRDNGHAVADSGLIPAKLVDIWADAQRTAKGRNELIRTTA
jgi:hypothetical protein